MTKKTTIPWKQRERQSATAHAQAKRSRGRFEFCLNGRRQGTAPYFEGFSYFFSHAEMAESLNVSDSDRSTLDNQSLSSRSSNRSLRVAEKERRKNEAEDPFVLALKYFSVGKTGRVHNSSWWFKLTFESFLQAKKSGG